MGARSARHPDRARRGAWLLGALLIPGVAFAQEPSPDAGEPFAAIKTGKTLRAFRITGRPPVIDGRLDDEPWKLAAAIEDFLQWEPDNLAPLSERTIVQVAYDDRYLYVAIRLYDRSAVTTGFGRRDQLPPSDRVGVGFDPRHDHQTAYIFETNPAAVQSDFSFFNDTQFNPDYDAVWEVQTAITGEGWMAEFRIPFSQMRFTMPAGGPTTWGFSVRRSIHRRGEFGEWVGQPRGQTGNVSVWGHLVFEGILPATPRRVEALPYVLGRRTALAGAPNADHGGAAGVDLRVGLGSSATLSATVNPDFGQVEQDPAVLNLTVFETFFPEKRPFFLEDSRTFVAGGYPFQLFHSRRIGRTPGRFAVAPDERVVDRPEETTLIGAAKLTGKTPRWTYGALTALTAREHATVETVGAGPQGSARRAERLIEPLTSYAAGRVQRDLGAASNVGAVMTLVVRERDTDAVTGGADYHFRWNRNRALWNGQWAFSRAPGAGGLKTGWGGQTDVGYFGKYVGMSTNVVRLSPDFRVNDIGFLRNRVDKTQHEVAFSVGNPDPWRGLRNIRFFSFFDQEWNTAGLRTRRGTGASVNMQLQSFWFVFMNAGRNFRVEDDLDTRGGPPIIRPAETYFNVGLNTDSRKTWRVNVNAGGARSEAGSWNVFVNPFVTIQPLPRMEASLGGGYNQGTDVAQWLANRDVTGDGAIDHVYGNLRRHVVDLTIRSTYAVHRDMTFQVYLQPFVAAGDYSSIRRLARPRSYDFLPAELAFDPDFNTKSLRGNVVFRWEYLRGSTLFVVWNLSAVDTARPGTFDLWRDLGDAFGADGTNAFIVKATYWLSR